MAKPHPPPHSTYASRPSHARALGHGWEAPALLLITVALLSFGLVSVYSASAVMAQSDGQADYYYVVRQLSAARSAWLALVVDGADRLPPAAALRVAGAAAS